MIIPNHCYGRLEVAGVIYSPTSPAETAKMIQNTTMSPTYPAPADPAQLKLNIAAILAIAELRNLQPCSTFGQDKGFRLSFMEGGG